MRSLRAAAPSHWCIAMHSDSAVALERGARRRVTLRAGAIAAALVALAIVVAPGAAHAKPARRGPADHGLFERTPLGFSWEILGHVRNRISETPQFISEIPQRVSGLAHTLGPEDALLRVLLAVTIILGLLTRRRSFRWIETRLAPIAARFPGRGALLISSASQVVAAIALPMVLWALYLFIAQLTDYDNPVFVVFGMLLLAWTEYALVTSVARELVLRPLLNVPPEHRRYLYRIAQLLAVYGIFIDALLESAAKLGALPDAVALYRWIFEFSLIVFMAVALLRRRAIMSLFPDMPNRMYRGFVRGLDRAYPLAYALTLITALLQWAGYRRLAVFVWIRTWAVAALFVVAVILHQALRSTLHRLILRGEVGSDEARTFYASARRLLDYVGSIIVFILALDLTGLRTPIVGALSIRLTTLGARPLTPLVLVEAAAIVAGFVIVAQLLRDYLQYQVYPALNVDPGVAHAIDTFIIYALAAVGGLAALEAVGLGVGTITLFAGAFGIGLGFGLQSLANNLASGMTIIFSRALRRGDIVTVGDTIGVVQEVGIRATRMRTRDDVDYLVPNAEFISGKIINWTRSNPHARLHVPLGVSYGADPVRVRQILEQVALRIPTVEKFPAPEVWFVGFGDSSLNFELLVWMNIRSYSRHKVASDLYFAIFEAFKEAGIEIPFPQRDLHIRTAEGLPTLAPRKDDSR
jgi:small-conductance mechanosensitive channel